MSKSKEIGRLLLEYGLINNDDLNEGLRFQKETGLRLGEALAELGKVNMDDIDWVLSKQLDIPFVIVEDINVNIELLEKFRKEFLLENRILPLYETADHISIVIEDPSNKSAIDFIHDLFGKKVHVSIGNGRKIGNLLKNILKKAGIPELINSLKDIIERIKGTSFYRIDFLLAKHSCGIKVFGSGILRGMMSMEGVFTREDIFRAFDDLEISFLYEQYSSGKNTFLAIYPLANRLEIISLPAIIGSYGLHLPDDTTFSNARIHGLSNFFRSDDPVQGYRYFSTKSNAPCFEKAVYTLDAAPTDFKERYINICMPEKCPACNGAGCRACRELGYEFIHIEGLYSSDELKEKLKEG